MTTWVLVAALPCLFLLGLHTGRRRPKPSKPIKHEHVWDMWRARPIEDPPTGKIYSGQHRECLACGYREVEFL